MRSQVIVDSRLSTLFSEVECIVNNHPLTVVPNDPGELEVLTPVHALFAKGDPGPLLGTWDIDDCFR